MDDATPKRSWIFGRRNFDFGATPLLMGIVNVTPDSFSDGGQFLDPAAAVDHALRLVDQGAGLLDIGGESTRPGALPVSLADELARVVPVVERLAAVVSIPISVDTTKAEVARQALAAGAEIINDISGLQFDPEMIGVCRDAYAGVICMHIQGTPKTMQQSPQYQNVVTEIGQYFRERLGELNRQGVCPEQILLDPGIGFGKTSAHNLRILSGIAELHQIGRPILVGHSRKRFLKSLVGRDLDERLAGGIGVSVALAEQGVECLRVHDVGAHRDALAAWSAVRKLVGSQ